MQRKWKRCWQRLAKIVLPPVAAGLLLLSAYSAAYANPSGGTVASGAASISANGSTMTVNQSSNKAIINWQNFDIGNGETVNFIQPGANSVALNRVVGSNASAIYGTLTANGKVFLINPNGVLFAPGSQVNVGGLVASTLNISDSDFLNGNYTFAKNGGAGGVTNRGNITATSEAVLLGPQVTNEGVIAAKVTSLAAGNKVSLDFSGDQLLNLTVNTGAAGGSAVNSGTILANGGTVIMSAGTAEALLGTVVNNSGVIRAQRINNEGGVIKLLGNTVNVGGTLDASAPNGGNGGFIETSGNKVNIADSAVITTKAASGKTGTWLIDPDGFTIAAAGGDITGAALSSRLASNNVTIASTQGRSTGGNIDVNDRVNWSANTTLGLNATNTINVNAVISGLNGGLALNAGTNINVNAPSSLQVASLTATATGDVNLNAPQVWTNNGTWTFNGTTINVNDTADWSNGTLTLNAGTAGGFINLNAAMTASNKAKLVVTYNPGMDTSTVDYTYQSYNWLTDSMDTITDTQPSATYGTPLGGINPLFAADGKSFIGKIDFINSKAANALTINGQGYTLITNMDQLASISTVSRNADGSVATDPDTGDPLSYTVASGNYALATDLDASGKVYPGTIVWQLTGNLEGLGHVVNNLTIKPPLEANVISPYYTEYSEDGALALIGTVGGIPGGRDYGVMIPIVTPVGSVRNLGVTNVSIQTAYLTSSLTVDAAYGASGLVDTNYGYIVNTFATGKDSPVITGSAFDGNINATDGYLSAPASVAISAVGASGLVGSNFGVIYGSHAAVDVYSPYNSAAGFVGWNQRSVGSDYYGDQFIGVILNSYATGNVYAGSNAFWTGGMVGSWGIGGFVGSNGGGIISTSYATGNVTTVNADEVGGFTGYNFTGAGVEMGTLNNVTSSGTLNLASTSIYDSGSAGGLVGDNAGNVNGGYTSSDIVITSYTTNAFGFPMKVTYSGAGAAFGNEEGTDNGVTATGSVLVDGASSYTYPSGYVVNYNKFTGGWDFGGTTNSTFNPGAGGTPPQQTATQAAQQAAVQQVAAARAQAQILTQQATAQQAVVAAAITTTRQAGDQQAAGQQASTQAASQLGQAGQPAQSRGSTWQNLLDRLNPANLWQSTTDSQSASTAPGSARIQSVQANGVEYQLEDNSTNASTNAGDNSTDKKA